MKSAVVITIGNELLSGDVVNTNAAFIATFLRRFGYRVERMLTVADDEEAITAALDALHPSEKLVFITGGLGPTNDDITRPVLARYFGTQLVFRPEIFQHIIELFARRGLQLPECNRQQAYFPQQAELIPNPDGCAPGMKFEKEGRVYLVLPGVPRELENMLKTSVERLLAEEAHPLAERLFHFFGIPESQLYERLQPWIQRHPQISFSFRPQPAQIDLSVLLQDSATPELLDETERFILHVCPDEYFGQDSDTMESVVGALLKRRQLTIAVAESCTGGLIAHRLTNVPGSSDYFKMGIVAYHNKAKEKILGVQEKTPRIFGAVSPETAREMAEGVRRLAATDLGLSTTGIAGPTGATPQKPVGLVYVGLATEAAVQVWDFQFRRDRQLNKQLFAQAALNQLRRYLIERCNR